MCTSLRHQHEHVSSYLLLTPLCCPGLLQEKWSLTRNQDLNVLHVADAGAFAASVSGRVVPGDSLIFDFIYFLHPVCPGSAVGAAARSLVGLIWYLQCYQADAQVWPFSST